MVSLRSTSHKRFFIPSRAIPFAVMVAVIVVCVMGSLLPKNLVNNFLYPIKYHGLIQEASARYGVDPLLICAVIQCESGWDNNAYSHAGAQGLMQVMPDTARSLIDMGLVIRPQSDAENLLDPATNIDFGVAYLAYLNQQLPALDQVLAAYNAGIGTVQHWLLELQEGQSFSDVINYGETKNYVERVQDVYDAYKNAYPSGLWESE